MITLLLETLTYYLLFPIIFCLIIYFIFKEKRDLIALSNIEKQDEIVKKSLKKSRSRIKKFEIILVITLLVFMPSMYVLSSEYSDTMAHQEVRGGISVWGRFFPILDPVQYQIGPSGDLEEVKEKMKDSKGVWHPEKLMEKIDFGKLDRFPGEFTLYRLLDDRIIVTYQYYTPIPMFKTYGVIIHRVHGTEELMILKEDLVVYPQSLDRCSRVIPD